VKTPLNIPQQRHEFQDETNTYCGVPLKAGISESKRPSIARQRLGNQVSCIISWVTSKHVHTTTQTVSYATDKPQPFDKVFSLLSAKDSLKGMTD
jgi:hypothetical protein